jgi:hypothetical protein
MIEEESGRAGDDRQGMRMGEERQPHLEIDKKTAERRNKEQTPATWIRLQ